MDDFVLYTTLTVIVAVILGFISFYKRKEEKVRERARPPRPRVGEDGAAGGARAHPPNRAAANRNARARMRAAAQRRDESDDDDDDDTGGLGDDIALPDGKIGKKKLAKLQAKAERRVLREAEEREREEKKERAEKAAEDRRKEEKREAEEEARKEEEEQKAREEKERREQEEYMKLKAEFEVQEEGFEEAAEDKRQNLLNEFVGFIKKDKVVVLEDLAARFKLKTQDVIDRVKELQKNGVLTGVIDDRGKFIYISKEELEGVAKFIRQRGRISIAELAESSNTLITLTPETSGAS